MPDDYQTQSNPNDLGMANLLRDFGIDTNEGDEPAADSTTSQPEASDAQGQAPEADAPATDSQESNAQAPEQDAKAALREQKSNQAFADMRARIAAYDKSFNLLKQTMGFQGTDEQFHEHLRNISYAQQAKQQGQGVDPNLLRRIDDLEMKNKMLEESNNKNMFASNIKNLQSHFNLTNKELEDFIKLAVDERIDLTIPGTNFITLYQGLNHDKLLAKAIEEERQKWLSKQAQGQQTGTAPDGKSGKSDSSQTDVNTMAEFNSLLNNLK